MSFNSNELLPTDLNGIAKKYLRKPFADCGKYEQIRVRQAQTMILCDYKGDGLRGCLAELFTCGRTARKFGVAGVNENDGYIRFLNTTSGKLDRVPIERKTNGGRLGMFYEKEFVDGCYIRHTSVRSKNRVPVQYIVYSMDYYAPVAKSKKNPNGGKVHREVPAKVIPISVFLDFLEENKLIKSTNGVNPEPAVQVSSAKLYWALLDWPIDYDPALIYRADDFEGLRLEVPPKELWI